jgi:hypothetical protein
MLIVSINLWQTQYCSEAVNIEGPNNQVFVVQASVIIKNWTNQITNIPIKMQRSNYMQVIVFSADENIECFYTNAMKSVERVQPITKRLSNHTPIIVP